LASLLAHAAIPLIGRKVMPPSRKLTIAAVALSIWPDSDLLTLAFEIRPNEPLGHRGLSHSLFVACALAAIVTFVWFRDTWRRTLPFLAIVAASHGLLDAATSGDVGVALFAPLTNARFSLPKLLPGCPMGLDEYLGRFGMLTLANEMLYVVLPLALVIALLDDEGPRMRLAIIGGVWLVCAVLLRTTWPESFAASMPRTMTAVTELDQIRHDDLPDGALVTRLDRLRALGLFDHALTPATPAWSSSFFPSWFGAESGRWMDGSPRLVWRTLFGMSPPTESDARAWMHDDARLFSLAPTEKIDLALGHYDFPATREALSFTHDARPRPRYWFGRCNGVSAAATSEPEPFRVVDVISKDGAHVRFHPNDVKALLAVAYSKPRKWTLVGGLCETVAFDPGAACSMNPAVLVIALLNRVGIAKQSIVVDVLPTIANQYYAVASVNVHIASEHAPESPLELAGKHVTSLVETKIDLVLSSTTLSYARANVREDDSHYARVGVVPVPFSYSATLAVADGELVGGRWTGNPPDGPDNVVIIEGGPAVDDAGMLMTGKNIPWELVQKLARASADDTQSATIDLR
jgi:inner membrane protein